MQVRCRAQGGSSSRGKLARASNCCEWFIAASSKGQDQAQHFAVLQVCCFVYDLNLNGSLEEDRVSPRVGLLNLDCIFLLLFHF